MENFWRMAKIISFRAPVLQFGTRSDLILLLLCDSTFYQGLSCSKHGKISKLWRKIILEKMENFWRTVKIWDENAATGTCFILMNLPGIKKHWIRAKIRKFYKKCFILSHVDMLDLAWWFLALTTISALFIFQHYQFTSINILSAFMLP